MNISKNAQAIKPSSTLAIAAQAKKLKEEGLDVVGFTSGEPDFDTPEYIKHGAKEALDEGFTKYTPSAGIIELRKAIADKLKKDNNLDYKYTQIVVSNGGKQGLFNVFLSILNPGDEVIVPSPYWLSYIEMIKICQGKPVIIETEMESNFKICENDLKKAITNKTKAIIINSPSNPTGVIYTKKELEMIANIAVEKDIYVISDEIYEKLIYSDTEHISIASLNKEIYDRTIVVNGFSKSYAMTGWRVGYTASPLPIAKAMDNIQSHLTSNICSISQKAALKALLENDDSLEAMKSEFKKRRDYMYDRLIKMPYIKTLKPEGAFYFFLDIAETYNKKYDNEEISSGESFATLLLEKELVSVIPCTDFGKPNFIRLSFSLSMENIIKGMDRLEKFLNYLK